MYVGKHSDINLHLLCTRDCIVEKGFIIVSVVNLLNAAQPLIDIKEFIVEKGSASAANVGNP